MSGSTTQRVRYVCRTCGSTEVSCDAWADWDEEKQEWVLGSTFDDEFCHTCEGETKLDEQVIS